MKSFKKIFSILLALCILLCVLSACGQKYSVEKLPKYAQKEFELSAFWAPYDISEEGLKTYKEAGFNTLAMINHSLGNTSEEQFYLGSKRTMEALENCKKVGLKAILNYNDWKAEQCEGEGYNGETPFSTYDLYGEYKDIISGIHICDEPKAHHIPIYGNQKLIDDFKKVYPDKDYIINLLPLSAGTTTWGYTDYEEMLTVYEENFMTKFDNPMISVDVYPFHTEVPDTDLYLATNYKMIAETAKKYNAKKTFILQASTGREFEENLSEADMRWEVNAALAFGADALQYYCYSVPKWIEQDGTVSYMYNHCIMNQDDTPSDVYYYIQKIHKEIQSYASVILSYDWSESIATSGTEGSAFRLGAFVYDDTYTEPRKFENAKHYVSATATQDLLISRFDSNEYGEAYMFVNFADRNNACTAEITFKDCGAVAIYGGEGYSGEPQILILDEQGKATIELNYGEGVFVTPLI